MFNILLGWEATKIWLSHNLHLTHHELHVIVGIILYFLFARLLRARYGSVRPLIPIAVLEGINESFDFMRYILSGWPWTPVATIYDIVLTLGPPMLIAVAFRTFRRRS